MKFPSATVEPYIQNGLITKRPHNTLPLFIYNYTPKCQYSRAWDEITMQCRGLIVDAEDNIVARPFSKFFNVEEIGLQNLPKEEFEVFDKEDGSLGILYQDAQRTPYIATRGSFHSPQAEVATQMLHEYPYQSTCFEPNLTYLFEIIYPENRIVLDYGPTRALVLLAIIHTDTGEEVPYEQLQGLVPDFHVVRRHPWNSDISHVMAQEDKESEGFVIRFKSGLRAKIKFAEYKRLHRVLTGVSTKTIWEILANGDDLEGLLEHVPDEFYDWVKATAQDMQQKVSEHFEEAAAWLRSALALPTRKEQALFLKNCPYSDVVFKMLDNRDFDMLLWKRVKPLYEKPFRKDEDDS